MNSLEIRLKYGREDLYVSIPDYLLEFIAQSKKEVQATLNDINKVLDGFMFQINKVKDKILKKGLLLLLSDHTRAVPNKKILPLILNKLHDNGFKDDNIRFLIAYGLHKKITDKDVKDFFGIDPNEYTVLHHDATNEEELIALGKTSFGTPVKINKELHEAGYSIGIGLIEPHFFAGYSGGYKIILPGISAKESIFSNHSYKMIDHPKSRYGILDGNPLREDIEEAGKMSGLDAIINVVINSKKEIAGVFAGDPKLAHRMGVKLLDSFSKVSVPKPTDIVITTNGGYPLDRNLYQGVKGMATAELVVKEGGVIIYAGECSDGLTHEHFKELMVIGDKPEDVLEFIKEYEPIQDQWEAQILARILKKAKIIVVTKNIKEKVLNEMKLLGAKTVDEALEMALEIKGQDARIGVIPNGPYVIPTIS